MVKRLCMTAVACLVISGAALAQSTPTADAPKSATGRTSADCDKLSDAARDVCMRDLQAADGKAKQPSTGGTAGSGGSSSSGGTAAQPRQTAPSSGGATGGAYGN
jgi:hypothetical protein